MSKAGVGWPTLSDVPAWRLKKLGVECVIDWGANLNAAWAAKKSDIEYLPMQWGCSRGSASVNVKRVRDLAMRRMGSRWLVFNEPDISTQACCTPRDAVFTYERLRREVLPVDPEAKFYVGGTAFYLHHIE